MEWWHILLVVIVLLVLWVIGTYNSLISLKIKLKINGHKLIFN